MSSAVLSKRILREIDDLAKKPTPGIDAKPKPENLRYFDVTISGPAGSPYEGGIFKLELFLPATYPMDAPKVRFLTRLYHPNVDKLGRICLNILKPEGWSPALQIQAVLLTIQGLLTEPNPDDPLDTAVAGHWKSDLAAAQAEARRFTRLYAMG